MLLVTDSHNPSVGSLAMMVGNNGCGPDSPEDFLGDLRATLKKSNQLKETLTLCYAGLYDVIVYPGGTFSLVPSNLIQYKIPKE